MKLNAAKRIEEVKKKNLTRNKYKDNFQRLLLAYHSQQQRISMLNLYISCSLYTKQKFHVNKRIRKNSNKIIYFTIKNGYKILEKFLICVEERFDHYSF